MNLFVFTCIHAVDPVERNSQNMKQEVMTLQEILNRLDFKRKVSLVTFITLFHTLTSIEFSLMQIIFFIRLKTQIQMKWHVWFLHLNINP